jgi:hypothetical protein
MEYPKVVYKDGACTDEEAGTVDDDGIPLNARVVDDEADEAAAAADGYLPIGAASAASDAFQPGVTKTRAKTAAKKAD